MHIYKKLYCDEKTRNDRRRLIRKIKYHGGLAGTHVIVLAQGADYFDIIPGYQLKQKHYPLKDMMILGLAGDYESAVTLVGRMLEDFSAKYNTYRFKNLLLNEKEAHFTGFNRK